MSDKNRMLTVDERKDFLHENYTKICLKQNKIKQYYTIGVRHFIFIWIVNILLAFLVWTVTMNNQ